nr:MAG TPA: hypothetical protein [Caudoviricetes sp.]
MKRHRGGFCRFTCRMSRRGTFSKKTFSVT